MVPAMKLSANPTAKEISAPSIVVIIAVMASITDAISRPPDHRPAWDAPALDLSPWREWRREHALAQLVRQQIDAVANGAKCRHPPGPAWICDIADFRRGH